jgi:hypothetical protein
LATPASPLITIPSKHTPTPPMTTSRQLGSPTQILR